MKMLYLEGKEAFQSRDTDQYKTTKYTFERAVKKAKANYRAKLETKLSVHDSRGVWHSLKQITNYKTNHIIFDDDPLLPNKLNVFYCRFVGMPMASFSFLSDAEPLDPPFLTEHDVRNLIKQQHCRQAAGSDQAGSAATALGCAD